MRALNHLWKQFPRLSVIDTAGGVTCFLNGKSTTDLCFSRGVKQVFERDDKDLGS